MDLRAHIRQIPDFPAGHPVLRHLDLLAHAGAWQETVDRGRRRASLPPRPLGRHRVAGFIFAAPVAYKLGVGFTMVRKVGKLPGTVVSHNYDLEYGSDIAAAADGLVPPAAAWF